MQHYQESMSYDQVLQNLCIYNVSHKAESRKHVMHLELFIALTCTLVLSRLAKKLARHIVCLLVLLLAY